MSGGRECLIGDGCSYLAIQAACRCQNATWALRAITRYYCVYKRTMRTTNAHACIRAHTAVVEEGGRAALAAWLLLEVLCVVDVEVVELLVHAVDVPLRRVVGLELCELCLKTRDRRREEVILVAAQKAVGTNHLVRCNFITATDWSAIEIHYLLRSEAGKQTSAPTDRETVQRLASEEPEPQTFIGYCALTCAVLFGA